MRAQPHRHPFVPDPKLMKSVPDEKFYPFAASQMFAVHLLESNGSAKQINK